MPRRLIRRYLPTPDKLRQAKGLGIFGDILFEPNMWHLNRKSFSGAFALGMFSAFIPVPFQMLISAAGALIFKVNLPLSVALVWITNPITMPPIFYFCYLVGAYALDTPVQAIDFELTYEWLKTELLRIWEPFLLGCFIMGVISSISSYFGARLFWRYIVVKSWANRKQRRLAAQNGNKE
ncbi:MAG: DUF2062 domain-containing protein [Gammaproteobacteria bacterium]|nr:DUF2062 domain-containing protein [Gammaproteobacteria bacterium]